MLSNMDEKPPISPSRRTTALFGAEIPGRLTLRMPPDRANDAAEVHRRLAEAMKCHPDALPPYRILRRSIDGRRGQPCYEITVALGASAVAPRALPPWHRSPGMPGR
jgi:hypothetical protein